jgi:hypothetical protein
MVSDLISPNGSWNLPLLVSLFTSPGVKEIPKIPISPNLSTNFLWTPSSNGLFLPAQLIGYLGSEGFDLIPFTERQTQGRQHLAQAHANRRVRRFKLDTPEFQGCLQPKEFIVTEKLEKFDKKKVTKEAAEIRSQSVEAEGDGFIEEDCSVDWASPTIYDTYPDKEMSYIHQVDFLRVDAILSKTFNQSCDEIYGVETTFLSKSKGVFVSSFGILMAYGKGQAQEKHDKSTWQSGVWGVHDKYQGMLMIKSVTFIMGSGLVVILRNGEWNELTGHPKDHGKGSPNSKANYLQPREDDVD